MLLFSSRVVIPINIIMKPIKFGKLTISASSPVIIVAEIADSHNGDLKTAKKLVEEAKKAGADVAKFQLHLPEVEMAGPKSLVMWDGDLYDILQRNLFTPERHKEMMKHCAKVGIEYLCTPFCPAAVDILNDLGVKAFKTGSGELANLPQHRKLAKISARTGKPVIVSTGMSTWEEISETVSIYEQEKAKQNLVLMNCTSEYPPNDYSHLNLGLLGKLKEEFGVWVGQSDHAHENYVALAAAAVAQGARLIEKHFTLSRKQTGPDHFIALEPAMLKELVAGVRATEMALGKTKSISKAEQVVRDWAFHSVIVNRAVKKGEAVSESNVRPARPGPSYNNWNGIPAKYLDERYQRQLLGKTFKKDFPQHYRLRWEDLV